MCSEPVTLGGGMTMRVGLGRGALGTAGLEGVAPHPLLVDAGFDVGGLIGLLEHWNTKSNDGGSKGRLLRPAASGCQRPKAKGLREHFSKHGWAGSSLGCVALGGEGAHHLLAHRLLDQARQVAVQPLADHGLQQLANHLLEGGYRWCANRLGAGC